MDEIYQNLPTDSEEAFLFLEERYRQDLATEIADAGQDTRHDVLYVDYIAKVIAAVNELDLEAEFRTKVPEIQDVDYNTYLNFNKDVQHYRTMLSIRRGRRVAGHSVKFDAIAKQKLRHHLEQMRTIVDKLEVEQDKRETLFFKIDALQLEVDRDRTRFESFADLTIAASGLLDTALGPINKLINNIGRVFFEAKEEETKKLPPPTSTKRIEGPKKELPDFPSKKRSKTRGDLDDEIPF
jgi:hypothetical protein